jgi:hypothetical protein
VAAAAGGAADADHTRSADRYGDDARVHGVERGPAAARLDVRRSDHVYAFMQAMGLVNDHVEECSVRQAIGKEAG